MIETELLDWRKFSTLTCDVDIWLGVKLPDEIVKMKRLHSAICKCLGVAETEYEEFMSICEQNPNPAWNELLCINLNVNDPKQACTIKVDGTEA